MVTDQAILGQIGQEISVLSIDKKQTFNDKEYEYQNSDPNGKIIREKDHTKNIITLIYWHVENSDPKPDPTPDPNPTPSVPSGGGGRSSGGSTSTSTSSRSSQAPVAIDIPEIPMADFPSEPVVEEIQDLDVPLVALPKTGDSCHTGVLLFLFGMAGLGVLISVMGLKKGKED